MLHQHKIAMFRVVEVDSVDSLERAVTDSAANRQARIKGKHGERHIILVKSGTYRMDPSFWLKLDRALIVGEISGPKPIFRIGHQESPRIVSQNVFINVHFTMESANIYLSLHTGRAILFLQCTFESNGAPNNVSGFTQEQKEKCLGQIMENMFDSNSTHEELEQKKLSEIERSLYDAAREMETDGNPEPALVVEAGSCALMKCDIKGSPGAGVLVAGRKAEEVQVEMLLNKVLFNRVDTNSDEEPFLCMKTSSVSNCGYSGVEAREQGSMFLEDCHLYDNSNGVLVWRNAVNVTIRGSTISANKKEGIHVVDANESYDNSTKFVLENSHVHHNQIGLSLEWVRSVSIQNCKVFSNRSWGIYMRNSNVASIRGNDVFRNDCGGIRVCFNRFGHTLVMQNLIHDHTGPDFIQTVLKSEGEQEMMPVKFNKEINRVPVIVLDNLSFNNDLSYGSIADWRISMERPCSFCDKKGAENLCQRCNKVVYCCDQCLTSDEQNHKTFCDYFTETNVVLLSLTPMKITRRSHLIEDRAAKKKLKDYRRKEFLIKITAGDDGFGLDRSGEKHFGIDMGLVREDPNMLMIYDEFRFISGTTKCPKIWDIVRQFGKLSGEKCYNKRIFLHARLHRGNKNELLVRTDQFFHEQGW